MTNVTHHFEVTLTPFWTVHTLFGSGFEPSPNVIVLVPTLWCYHPRDFSGHANQVVSLYLECLMHLFSIDSKTFVNKMITISNMLIGGHKKKRLHFSSFSTIYSEITQTKKSKCVSKKSVCRSFAVYCLSDKMHCVDIF